MRWTDKRNDNLEALSILTVKAWTRFVIATQTSGILSRAEVIQLYWLDACSEALATAGAAGLACNLSIRDSQFQSYVVKVDHVRR